MDDLKIEEITDTFYAKATLIVGRGEDDAWLIDKKDFNAYATALQSYMRREVLKARLDEIEPYVKYVYTSNTAQNNAYERKKDLKQQLKLEKDNGYRRSKKRDK